MFEFVRSHKRVLQFVLVVLIFPSFVFFGVQGYSRFTDESFAPVAEVSGRNITRNEWEQAHQRSIEQLRADLGAVLLHLKKARGAEPIEPHDTPPPHWGNG